MALLEIILKLLPTIGVKFAGRTGILQKLMVICDYSVSNMHNNIRIQIMLNPRAIRSIMFTPALRLDRFHQIFGSFSDLCLLDCEDSVSVVDKEEARKNLYVYLEQSKVVNKPMGVRVNGLNTADGKADILALKNCRNLPDYIVIPKVETGRDIISVVDELDCRARGTQIIALIENIKGVQNVEKIAAASPDLAALMFGAADYTRSIEGEICWDTLLFPRTMIIHAACNNNIGAIDTPYFDMQDLDGLRNDCKRVKNLGFTGRCVIHPSQVSVINEMFSYSSLDLEQAKRIVTAARLNKGNICRVDGKMVGTAIIQKAFDVLKSHELAELNHNN